MALLKMQVDLEAVMHSWEFINHLREAAMGLTFGKIRVRPTLCPTLQDFLTPHTWFLFTLISFFHFDFFFNCKGEKATYALLN